MRRSIALSVALLSLGLMAIRVAAAHHSFAMFDGNRVVVLRATMLSFSYMNPHTWLSVMVDPGGDVPEGRWDIEATSPTALAGQGIRADTFKKGDKLTVGIRPLKDGRHGGSFVFVVDTNGKAYGADPAEFGLNGADLKP